MKKIIGSMTFLIAITLACYAHAGFFDRYLELVDVLYAVLKTIFVSQVVVFLLIKFCRFKIAKRIRMRLLLLSKRLCKNQWVNLFAAWALSSFVLTSYWYVFSQGLFILAIMPFLLFWMLYSVVVFRKKLRVRWLSGLKAIYFYLIASIGQIIGLLIYFLPIIISWYIPECHYRPNKYLLCGPPFIGVDYIFANGMLFLSALLAIPYLLLATYRIVKFLINNKT